MKKKLLSTALVLAFATSLLLLSACGSKGSEGTSGGNSSPTSTASGESIKIGFNEGFTGFMATNAMLIEHGILTAMAEVDNQVLGRPIEYVKADNASDPVNAVDKARQQVEQQGIHVMIGPQYSPATKAITQYLATAGGIPQISLTGQPAENLQTANGLAFMPSGFYGTDTYELARYCVEELGLKTANAICYEDTASRALQKGFNEGFTEAGGKVLEEYFLPPDVLDFSSYLGSMKKADCTVIWIYGNGVGPFIRQYADYGIKAKLVTLMASSNISEPVMSDLGDQAAGIVGIETFSPEYDSPGTKAFVEAYVKQWKGEYPTADSYTGYLAVKLFLAAVEKTGGDTTPAKLIEALSTNVVEGPMSPVSFTPYEDAFVGTINLFVVESERVSDKRIAWTPLKTIEHVLMTPRE